MPLYNKKFCLQKIIRFDFFTLLRVHFDVVKMLRSQRGSVMTFQFCVWVVQFGIVTLKLGVRIL